MTKSEANMLARAIADEMVKRLAPMSEELLTADECAALLKTSRSWVQHHTGDPLPFVRVGGLVRYPKSRVLTAVLV